MMLLFAASLLLTPARAQEAPRGVHVLSLSCVEALVASGESRLAGVFAFVAEKDEIPAFADLLVHDPNVLKKFIAKADKDLKEAQGVSQWDRDALAAAASLFSSPLGETVAKPAQKTLDHILQLASAPALTLEQLNAKRKR